MPAPHPCPGPVYSVVSKLYYCIPALALSFVYRPFLWFRGVHMEQLFRLILSPGPSLSRRLCARETLAVWPSTGCLTWIRLHALEFRQCKALDRPESNYNASVLYFTFSTSQDVHSTIPKVEILQVGKTIAIITEPNRPKCSRFSGSLSSIRSPARKSLSVSDPAVHHE